MNAEPAEVFLARVLASPGKDLIEPLFGENKAKARKLRDLPVLPVGSIVSLVLGEGARVLRCETLAEPATASAAFYEILSELNIDPVYPPEVRVELEQILRTPEAQADQGLSDLRALPFVTIDNEGSRDLDQALCLSRNGRAGFLLDYALADAAHYIRPGSALFDEALRRGVTYYLPGFSVPMLPPELSEDRISLNPRLDRRALVFRMRLAEDGSVIDNRLVRAWIHSRAKLTYDGVQEYYDRPAESPLRDQSYSESLKLLKEVGELLLRLARRRDVVQFNRHELEVHTDPDGVRLAIRGSARNDCSLYNEQISLLCNTEGARLLVAKTGRPMVQPVFRVHEPPPPAARSHLQRVLARMVDLHELDAGQWSWRRDQESLADFLARLPKQADRRRLVRAIERQVLLCNQRSMFSAEPGQHYALRVEAYSRFSSPMREIVGIFTHKEALEGLGFEPAGGGPADEVLRERVIQSANRSKNVQRNVEKRCLKLAVDHLLRGDLLLAEEARPRRPATVLGMSHNRIYVQLDSPPVELKIYLDDLAEALGEELRVDEDEVRLRSVGGGLELRVGDGVRLRTRSYDEARGRWMLMPERMKSAAWEG